LSRYLREDIIREAIDHLDLPKGSKGIDVGCGTGFPTRLLADAIGKEGHITGIDISSEFLEYAEKISQDYNITYTCGDMYNLPFDDDLLDWGWSMDCVGFNLSNTQKQIDELVRVIRPGGTIALAVWSNQLLLPGHPHLEATLNTTPQGIAPFTKGSDPTTHFHRMIGRFQRMGLKDPKTETFIDNVQAPLGKGVRDALLDLFEMRWSASELPEDLQEEYLRLIRPDSPDFILDLPDYHAFFTYSLYHAKK